MQKKEYKLERETTETKVKVNLNIDGSGVCKINTGIDFFDHILLSFSRHGLFDLEIDVSGDSNIHHAIENVALALGEAFWRALGDNKEVRRIACEFVPQDEVLGRVVVDIGAIQGYAVTELLLKKDRVENIDQELFEHFIRTLAYEARFNINAAILHNGDDHHKIEAIFKALGRAINSAVKSDKERPSINPKIKVSE